MEMRASSSKRITGHGARDGERQRSHAQATFKVAADGNPGRCQLNGLDVQGVLILIEVRTLARMGAIIDFHRGVAF